jgi:hypothetical protein
MRCRRTGTCSLTPAGICKLRWRPNISLPVRRGGVHALAEALPEASVTKTIGNKKTKSVPTTSMQAEPRGSGDGGYGAYGIHRRNQSHCSF